MKNFNEFNESIRDQMTPKSEQDMKNNIGEDNYKKYIMLLDAKDSIKTKHLADEIIVDKKRDKVYFDIQIMLSIFTISIENNRWKLELQLGYDNFDEYYDTWDEVLKRIKEVLKNKIIEDIDEKQDEINKLQSAIKIDKRAITNVDENL